VLHAKKRNETMKILLENKKEARLQIAHLQFARANAPDFAHIFNFLPQNN
jgi:hypothetical protein